MMEGRKKDAKRTVSLEDQVYTVLEQEILTGTAPRGAALREISLSQRLNVSRTPIRSALHRLAEEGLVELLPNRSAVVAGVTREDVIDMYEIRMRLEGLAARYAAARMTEAEKQALAEEMRLTERSLQQGDTDRLQALDDSFHARIYRASGSRFLRRILGELHRHLQRYRLVAMRTPGRREASVAEHRAIMDAVLAGDGDRAEAASRQHAEQALACILAAVVTADTPPEPVRQKRVIRKGKGAPTQNRKKQG